jgi:competence protein ComGF
MKSILESLTVIAIIATLFMGVMYLLKQGVNYIDTFDLDTKREAFENQKTFLCATGITNNQKLLVSKNNNWEIYKETYFKREDMLLEIRLCRVEE